MHSFAVMAATVSGDVVASGPWVGVLPWIVGLACLGATAALAALSKKLLSQDKATVIGTVMGKVAEFASLVVADLEATLKPQIAGATKDGQLSVAEVTQLRNAALERLKTMLGQKGLEQLGRAGIAPPAVDAALHGVIEREVAKLSALKHAATAAVTTVVSAGPLTPR